MSDEEEKVVRQEVAHFVIGGDYMTELIQQSVLEDAPGRAWRLAESLIGEGAADAAMGLVKGTHRLTGDSTKGMTLVPTSSRDRRAFEKKVDRLYAGRMRIGVLWFRPVAWIDGYGPEDMRNAHGRPVYRRHRGYENRGWHYAGHNEVVLLAKPPKKAPWRKEYIENYEDDYIFEPCGERPHWMTPCRDATQALKEWYEAGRGLDHRGWIPWYAEQHEGASEAPRNMFLMADKKDKQAVEDAEDAEYELARQAQYNGYQDRILEQAGDDVFTFSFNDKTLRIPRAPFLHWVLDRAGAGHLAPPWTPVSPSGLKIMLDDPNHNDWVIGAGLPLNYDDRPLHDALFSHAMDMARTYTRSECGIIAGGPHALGPAYHPAVNEIAPTGSIVILPNLQPKWLPSVQGAAAIVTEQGGPMAHLAQIALERRLPIVRIKDACTRYPAGTVLSVDCDTLEVRIHEKWAFDKDKEDEERS